MINLLRKKHISRLSTLHESHYAPDLDQSEIAIARILRDLDEQKKLDEKLLVAGFLTTSEQKHAKRVQLILLFLGLGCGFLIGLSFFGLGPSFIFAGLGLYGGLVAYVSWISFRKKDAIRSVYYELPLVLEELVLLVESGLALFPALEEVCVKRTASGVRSPRKETLARRVLLTAYQLAAHGVPISDSFKQVAKVCPFPVLRHVLLHLDISSSVGGELLYSLRALSEQIHKEWKLSVETRVRQLENLVVFPVFVAVMGLMLLTAAVPLVPVLDFMSSMKNKNTTISSQDSLGSDSSSLRSHK